MDYLTAVSWDPIPQEEVTGKSFISAAENSAAWKRQKAGTASELSQLGYAENIIAAYSMELSEVDATLRSAPTNAVSHQRTGRS